MFDELVDSGKSPSDLAQMIGDRSALWGLVPGSSFLQSTATGKLEDFFLSPDAFSHITDAETVGDQIGQFVEPYQVPYPIRASNDRIGGAQLMYRLMKDEKLKVSTKCPELISVMPAISHDPDKLEQTLKMDGDDPYDGVRYGVYSRLRPRLQPEHEKAAKRVNHPDPTIRHIQALIHANQLKESNPMTPVPYGRRY